MSLGLNVIVGPSNNGKSSVLKAIKSLAYTVTGSSPIRSGEKFYQVGVEYNNHSVLLQKSPKDAIYIVDGEEYTKFGTNTPQPVSEALNIKELVLNNNKEQLNFWEQMTYPFLLDKTGGELFKFIVDSGDNDKLNKILKTMVADRQNISKEIDKTQGSINILDTNINNYNTLLEGAEDKIATCNNIISLSPQVAKLKALKQINSVLQENYTNKANLLAKYNKTCESFAKARDVFTKLYNIRLRITKYTFIKDNLDSIFKRKVEALAELNKSKRHKSFDFKIHEELVLRKKLFETINYITSQQKLLKIQPRALFGYSEDTYKRLVNLKQLKAKISNTAKNKNECTNQLATIDKTLEQYRNIKEQFKVCPCCGRVIEKGETICT